MPDYRHPGVYVEEIPSGPRPIGGVAMSTAAFIGETRKGPVGEPVLIGKFDDFVKEFGAIESEADLMGLALQAFYLNGGGAASVCRLAASTATASNSATAILGEETGTNPVLSVMASSPGSWGNDLRFKIIKPDPVSLTFSLSVGELVEGEYEEREIFDHLSMNAGNERYVIRVVNENSDLVRLTDEVMQTDYCEASIVGTSVTLASVRNYLIDTSNDRSFMLNLNGTGFREVTLPDNSLIDADSSGALSAAGIANAIESAIVSAFAIDPASISVSRDSNRFTVATTLGADETDSETEILFHDSALLGALGIANETATVVQGVKKVIPQQMLTTSPGAGAGVLLEGGEETPPDAGHYTSFYETIFCDHPDVPILVLPGASWDGGLGQAKVEATISHCEKMKNRIVIIDPPTGVELTNRVEASAPGFPTSGYAVLYYPWVNVFNPLYRSDESPGHSKMVTIAPSAIAAGVWARIDSNRGIWKAPAGFETRLIGAVSPEFEVGAPEQNQLNPLGINCIRKLRGIGPLFWGARTLATMTDPEWRYIPVRRTAIYIEESISRGIQWAVFEPNDHPLWSSLRANIGSFMNDLFRAGAFQGASAKEAYFVRCGFGDTMTQNDIDRGQVIVMVGFAPLKPAEFVIVRIQQKVGEAG
ncbi:MAG: phage tail sheath subtilisin-like domain-containing protein [Chromatiales bacterium]